MLDRTLEMLRQVVIMGVRLTDQPFADAVRALSAACRDTRPQTVVFPNAATLNLACEIPGYREALNAADFVFGDGSGVRIAASQRGVSLQANLNGTDLVPALLKANPGLAVYLLGGTQDMVAAAAAGFAKRFPQVRLVGHHHGYFDHNDSAEVIARINAAKPDLLFVGFGNPLQEQWLHRHRDQLQVPLSAGVGGLFAYWAGALDRAPGLLRRAGLEWVHLLIRQPHKARRYLLGNPLFLWRARSWKRDDRAAIAAAGRTS